MASPALTTLTNCRRTAASESGAAISSPRHAAARPTFRPKRTGWNSGLHTRVAPYGIWVLRVVLGALFLEAVMRTVFGYVPADTARLFALPSGISAFALAWEMLLGLALLYGFWARGAAIAAAATLLIAALGAHGLAPHPEFDGPQALLWIAALIAIGLMGDGAFALVPTTSRIPREGNR